MNAISSNKSFLLAASPLFLVLFIDSMGLGLVIPLLNDILINPASNFLPAATSVNLRNFLFGSTIGIFMLSWFFGASFLGDLSDQIGRKKSLMICLLGAFLGYALSALGVLFQSFTWLVIGRVIAGFTGGSQAIAQAAIVDLSTPEHKARNLGLILFAMSIGFIFGPLIGGLLSNHDLHPSFNYAMPFYFAAAIALLNALFLQIFFKETFYKAGPISVKIHRAIEIFASGFRHKPIRGLSITFLIMVFGWSGFYSFISMFLTKKFGFGATDLAWYMAVMGVGFGIGTGILVEFFTRRFSLFNTVIGGLIITIIAVLITTYTAKTFWIWLCVIPIGAAMALVYSVLLTIFSNQVDADSQGWAMGITGAIMAFAFGINGLMIGLLADFSPAIPLLITVASLAITALLLQIEKRTKIIES